MTAAGSETIAVSLPTLGPANRMSHQRWVICSLLFLATVIAYVDRGVIAYLEKFLEDRDPGPQQHQVRIHPRRVSGGLRHRHGGGRRTDRQAGHAQGIRHRHLPLERCGHAAGRWHFRSSLSASPCFCSAWARRPTFLPASRLSPSGFPSASARWPPESSTPAPISATSRSR